MPGTKSAGGGWSAEQSAELQCDRDLVADRVVYSDPDRHREAERKKERPSPRKRSELVGASWERRQAQGQPLSLSGTRAFGVSSLVALTLCAIVVHSRMYYSLHQQSHEARPQQQRREAQQAWTSHGPSVTQEQQQARRVDLTLQQAVENVAGPNRSIIFVSTSRHYLTFLENW